MSNRPDNSVAMFLHARLCCRTVPTDLPQITDACVAELQRALPQCRIYK